MHGGRLSFESKKVEKIRKLALNWIKLPAVNKTTSKDVQAGRQEVSLMHKTSAKFCFFLHVKTIKQQQGVWIVLDCSEYRPIFRIAVYYIPFQKDHPIKLRIKLRIKW